MRIGTLAQHSGCNIETVRFYEKKGLLDSPSREANGYRCYADTHLVQLNFIRHCRSLGMGLEDIRRLHELQGDPGLACDEINQLVDTQIARIHKQVEALRMLEQQLHALRNTCRATSDTDQCAIMHNLEKAAKGDGCPCHPDRLVPGGSLG